MKIIMKRNAVYDWCVGFMGGATIPTKQDKFKPLIGYQGVLIENNKEVILNNLYVKQPDKDAVQEFEKEFREFISQKLEDKLPIKYPKEVEVVLVISVEKKRFFNVDVDNLTKTVLDCLKGLVIDDDSQIVNIYASKFIHPEGIPGIMIGLRELNEGNKSILEPPHLFSAESKTN